MSIAVANSANENCGWADSLPVFVAASRDEIVNALIAYVRAASPEQIRAWKASVSALQQEGRTMLEQSNLSANRYGAVLEYLMPDGAQRADAVILLSGAVLVLEMKGNRTDDSAALEQVSDYARRLSWYHVICQSENMRVHAVLVGYGQHVDCQSTRWHTVADISQLPEIVRAFDRPELGAPPTNERFISSECNQPTYSLVQAARRFFANQALPRIKRIDTLTQGAVDRVLVQIHQTHLSAGRTLILVTGVPGAGKTYVGLRIAHESGLDELSEPLPSGRKPVAPAVFLSGNGPLVEVLQYELRRAGGDGRVFVRGVREFVERYSKQRTLPPPHHVLVFDEAQRAWDEERVRLRHHDSQATSEPLSFLRFAERVPKWSVVVAFLGLGQEIHLGEESGIQLWVDAVRSTGTDWRIVGPANLAAPFRTGGVPYETYEELHLSHSVRFHFAEGLSEWTSGLVERLPHAGRLAAVASILVQRGYQLRVTRDLAFAKEFLWKKYSAQPEARFGLLVSSRDKALAPLGVIARDSPSFRPGPWYSDPETSPSSCRRLQDAISEFKAQGLELDHTLVVWGGDFVLRSGEWETSGARGYAKKSGVRDAVQLRRNAYRVLLTRGREGMIICLPKELTELDELYAFLLVAGCESLS